MWASQKHMTADRALSVRHCLGAAPVLQPSPMLADARALLGCRAAHALARRELHPAAKREGVVVSFIQQPMNCAVRVRELRVREAVVDG